MQHERRILPLFLVGLGRKTILGRGKARRLLLRALEALEAKCIRTTYRGVPFLFHLDNPTERRAVFGRYDDRELNFLLAHMGRPGSVFVDIGANSGFYSNFILAKAAEGSTVLSIEPNPQMTARLLENADLLSNAQRAAKTLIVANKALSDRAGHAFLDLETGLGSAHLVETEKRSSLRVETVPLASLFDQHRIERVDALKIDVEGHEDRVLTPFLDEAPDSLLPRSIVIEHTSSTMWRTDVITRLLKMGYRRVRRTRGNTFLAR